ncbi:MAG: M28 family peptidase [Planctomycetota bacterium]
MKRLPILILVPLLAASFLRAQTPAPPPEDLVAAVSPKALRSFHELAAGRVHRAGTPADLEHCEALAAAFRKMGYEVELHEIHPYLPSPVRAELEIVAPERLRLPVKERVLDDDPWSADEEIEFGWNAYAASGEVTAEVVYANFGRDVDFARLRELGVDCRGKIVLARYGGNYRGYKAKFAEEAGAAGLVIFSDPADAGYGRGLSWPEGGWANDSSIQRGSILTLPWAGDPLTPGVCATADAERLDPAAIALPRIPVQPIGWAAAQEILGRMRGREAPGDWQGRLPFRYRLVGGSDLRVRVLVEQKRSLAKTFNIVATLPGRESPDDYVVFGSHHDAWTFGAADPCAGVITVLEAARVLAERAFAIEKPWRPRRGIRFALWGAEEQGIIGSTEWVESRPAEIAAHAIAYVNLDMAAMGLQLSASASPSLEPSPSPPRRGSSIRATSVAAPSTSGVTAAPSDDARCPRWARSAAARITSPSSPSPASRARACRRTARPAPPTTPPTTISPGIAASWATTTRPPASSRRWCCPSPGSSPRASVCRSPPRAPPRDSSVTSAR